MSRDKPPSKDGTAQRKAKEVEGLKDFVSHMFFTHIASSVVVTVEVQAIRLS